MTAEQVYEGATTMIQQARESVRVLMNQGLIPPVPLVN